MCGRMSLFKPAKDTEGRFGAEFNQDWQPRYNIAPQQNLAVIQNDAPEEINQLTWDLIPHWVDDPDDWPKPFNARAETVAESSTSLSPRWKRKNGAVQLEPTGGFPGSDRSCILRHARWRAGRETAPVSSSDSERTW